MKTPSVLIVGAGPTGLVLALNLARRGVTFRLIDAKGGPGEHSRAMAVQARTLEFYRQLGFGDEVVAEGIVVQEAHFREADRDGRAREIAKVKFGNFGAGLSPYPFVLTYPQDDHERLLVKELAAAGVAVEWNTQLESFTADNDGVTATVIGPNGLEEIKADYICGCDGAHSRVRESLGLSFAGKTYAQPFFVCDCRVATGFVPDLSVSLGEYVLVLMFPVRSSGMQRLIGLLPSDLADRDDITFETIRDRVELLLNTRVSEVNWFSTYRVHSRVTEQFRVGRAFILGDAGHIHSPAGGQGMNTGIGDAMNLGWKLAGTIRGRTSAQILDTFEQERVGFAHRLLKTTDRIFSAMVASGLQGKFVRRVVAPILFVVSTDSAMGRRRLFRIVSQTRISYPESSLSEGRAGNVRGGDRLPWVQELNNFAPLSSLDWQLHVYGKAGAKLKASCARDGVPVHEFSWNDDVQRAGFARDGSYLVRPDGYVALALEGDDASSFDAYVSRIGLASVPETFPAS